ncbi:SDR family NAD(P)-dependent oxidoreductase [Croceicoccus sp. YJ47]|uniref:SDR family NAD(P)-dependent oxidoreductase n=1 Tax=Croceicoccus sp. YJ47 TaxID=2798724 RepID=UPI001922AD42|nr:SDR family NAD(P)-dependent oxidoreductase [Croceicoccus sp. YJ47]QQN73573.1 SDR family NAD(P)-dependent oxidoreductase [Croceicoccus sp. YJ47]
MTNAEPARERSCVIFGASGGVGDAMCRQLAASGPFARIYAGARSGTVPESSVSAPGMASIIPFAFDLTQEAGIAAIAERVAHESAPEMVIVATGLLQREPDIRPERSWRTIEPAAMAEMFAVNTIGPAIIGKHFLPLLRHAERPVFAALSARVGSIGDNGLGGWHSYRASKAALNMVLRNFGIELHRRNREGIVVALHPGTVETALSEPFRGNVPDRQLFTPEHSARCLLSVIDGLTAADNGGFFAWDGSRIAW